MTVIAKLTVRNVVEFGTGTFVELGCIAENDLMAAYATKDEDKLFSRYSPWGEVRLHQRNGWAVFTQRDAPLSGEHVDIPGKFKAFYAILVAETDVDCDRFKGASAYVKMVCYSKAKFAQDGSRVELREAYGWSKGNDETDYRSRRGVIDKLSWKMQVDNPPAEAQFVPGATYWLAFYDCEQFDMSAALAAAHGHDQ